MSANHALHQHTWLPVTAQEPGFQDALLDNFAGNWVLEGTIAGAMTTHDIVAEWIVGHQYLRFHEVSREKGDGQPKQFARLTLTRQ